MYTFTINAINGRKPSLGTLGVGQKKKRATFLLFYSWLTDSVEKYEYELVITNISIALIDF